MPKRQFCYKIVLTEQQERRENYHELQGCSATGAAYCAFLFQNKNGEKLRVVTKYEEWEDSSTLAKVAGCLLNP